MSNQSRRDISRAEARRRARRINQGLEVDEPRIDDAAPPRSTAQPSLFDRLFPAAPALRGRPDPLAGFAYDGPMRPVVTTLYLLTRNPLAWIAMGVLFAVAYLAWQAYPQNLIGIVASMLTFITLIAAGWLGWQRPWAYGLAAAVVGYLLYVVYLLISLWRIPASGKVFDAGNLLSFVLVNGLFQLGIGVISGFYGGYLRRRMGQQNTNSSQRRRR